VKDFAFFSTDNHRNTKITISGRNNSKRELHNNQWLHWNSFGYGDMINRVVSKPRFFYLDGY
jgi:hypothetical protein